MKRNTIVLLIAVISFFGQSSSTQQQDGLQKSVRLGQSTSDVQAVDLSAIDKTQAPCNDFYNFANGAWLARTTIPAELPSYGTVAELQERVDRSVSEIISSAADAVRNGKVPSDSDLYKVGAYYDSCIDSARVERLGLAPLQKTFERIAGIASAADLMQVMGELLKSDAIGPIRAGAAPDQKNSSAYIFVIAFFTGLGLPNRDYYVRGDEQFAGMRAAYEEHIRKMFELEGETADSAAAHAHTVLQFEINLARLQPDPAAARDPKNTYNRITVPELKALTPHIPWGAFLDGLGVPAITEVNARYPESLRGLDDLVASVPLDDWKMLLRWHVLNAAAPALPERFAAEDFAFTSRLTGVKARQPRPKACGEETRRAMGDIIAKEYVKQSFSAAAREKALAMTKTIVAVLRERIAQLSWMGDSTREAALAKVDAIRLKVGYPDRWHDYSALRNESGEYLENRRRLRMFSWRRDLEHLGQRVNKDEWRSTPTTVGGFYGPPYNDITSTAALLQPPLFDVNADDAVNYGAAGAIIGHELTHGFDVTGRQFDAAGNMRDWWTKADAEQYAALTRQLVDQFNGYPIDSQHRVNGQSTLGENISDLGGLKIAYLALQQTLRGKPRRTIDGFTPEQRFFLAYAHALRTLERPEALLQAGNATHAPMKWRVNGPLSNMPEFAKAWGCKPGDPMLRPDNLRVVIW